MIERILLTGASGFVGTYLRPALATRWPAATIAGLGATDASTPDCMRVDLLDVDAVVAVVRAMVPDLVIHLAGQSSVALAATGASATGGDPTWMVNLSGSLNLAMAVAAHAPRATLLFASSSEVYGASFLGGPVCETSPPLPMNAYAKSKLLAEQMFAAVLPASTPLIVARPFNHTGPGQRDIFVLPSLAEQVARIEAGVQPARMAVGNLEVRRDFLDVRDVAAAYLALIVAGPRLPPRFTCNIASGDPRRLADLLDILRALSTTPFAIDIDPARLRPVDLPSATATPNLLHATTGWTPTIKIEDTLGELLKAARWRTKS